MTEVAMNSSLVERFARECTEYIEGTLDGDIVVFDHKRFAQLILGQVIELADQFELEVNHGGLVDAIKSRFGVEK
jgi:hypothetical protein